MPKALRVPSRSRPLATFLTVALALPIGVMAAIYLEEYARESWLKSFIQINISNLAGVPSIIYGLLGLTIFVRQFGLGRSILAGAMTMALLVLPLTIPVLIFGVSAAEAAAGGTVPFFSPFAILCAITLVAVALCPFAAAAALRHLGE